MPSAVGNCISVIIVIRQKSKKMADETVNDISIENESENNLVQLYKSKFEYCSEFFLLKKCSKIWSQKHGKKRRLCSGNIG